MNDQLVLGGRPWSSAQVFPSIVGEKHDRSPAGSREGFTGRMQDRSRGGSRKETFAPHGVRGGRFGNAAVYLVAIRDQDQIGNRRLKRVILERIPPMGSSTKGSTE